MRRRSFARKPRGLPPCWNAFIQPGPAAFSGVEFRVAVGRWLRGAESRPEQEAGNGRGPGATVRAATNHIGAVSRRRDLAGDSLHQATDRILLLPDPAMPPSRL